MNILFLFAVCAIFLPPLGEGTNNLEDIPSGSSNNEAADEKTYGTIMKGFVKLMKIWKIPKEDDQQQKDEQFLMSQIYEAKKWALDNGMIINPINPGRFAPFSLFPSPFPRALFHKAVDVQKSLQLLYFRAMRDLDFLKEMHRAQTETNKDVRQTVNFIENCYKGGFKQPLTLFCQRAEFMAHESEENNENKLELKHHVLSMANAEISPLAQPPNHTDTMVAKALHMAWNEFGNNEAVILFLHSSRVDQRFSELLHVKHEIERISNGQTKCVFLFLREAVQRLTRHPENFSLILDGQILVAVVDHYYSSSHQTPHQNKFIFEIVRGSTAIQNSCTMRLAHTKRMQQVFTLPGVVERFFPRPEEVHMVKAIREVLIKSWSIGKEDEEAEEIIKNHLIFPVSAPLLNVAATPVLGIFGCLLGNIEDGTVLQQFSGEAHQMMTKLASENEGGIWKGNSVYDSPLLV
ncbi:hypothetical protein niasHT_012835 [Heterodera trifolii]|uniref:Glutathione synthetase n=1 Tax=Heterodera trifolii TaxID=157864 RepID=A0ABD2KXR8_9BILA